MKSIRKKVAELLFVLTISFRFAVAVHTFSKTNFPIYPAYRRFFSGIRHFRRNAGLQLRGARRNPASAEAFPSGLSMGCIR